ncbi:hydratase [Shewanella sp. 202IG2-18]|uniref:hydratase n=1 Tax=Parashewanella hymeniacidonis TaxID=2807618 RepID=UPI0019603ADB|nr:hydratase [Parashewanella hymeniacidonis]MBM7074169.1 hydratase [Parashewanella hymeniacidonis]
MNLPQELASRRLQGTPGDELPISQRPTNFEQAFSLQQQVSDSYCDLAATRVNGWKCVLPTTTVTMLAPLFENGMQTQTKNCVLFTSKENMALVEPEIASVFNSDLPVRDQPYTDQEIENAIGSTHFALELMQSRYHEPDKVTYFEALADGLLNQGVYIGPEIPKTIPFEDMAEFELNIASEKEVHLNRAVTHPNNHPRVAVYWLVNELRERGIAIKAGDKVITGSYAGIVNVPFDQPVTFKYGELGAFSVTFKAK